MQWKPKRLSAYVLRKNVIISCRFCLGAVPRWPWFMSGYTLQMSVCSVLYDPQCHVRVNSEKPLHICPGVNVAAVLWSSIKLNFCLCVWQPLFVDSHLGASWYVRSCKGVCLCMFGSGEQSVAGLSVPPDVTLLSSGADPAAEVGRPTAPLQWVGENRRAMWAGWRYGLAPRLRAKH